MAGEQTGLILSQCLIEAIKVNNTEKLRSLIAGGANLDNCYDMNNTSPLMWACKRDNVECVRILMEHDFKINEQNKQGFTALMFASKDGNDECLHLLLDKIADLQLQDDKDTGPIQACNENRRDPVDMQNDLGYTAPMQAFSKDVKNDLEYTSPVQAFSKDVKKHLDMQDDKGHTALIQACSGDRRECVKLLLEHKANTEVQDYYRNVNALIISSAKGYSDCVQLLINAGASVNEVSKENHSALYWALDNHLSMFGLTFAVDSCYPATVNLLLQSGADITNLQHFPQKTELLPPSEFSSYDDNFTVLKLLLTFGFDVIWNDFFLISVREKIRDAELLERTKELTEMSLLNLTRRKIRECLIMSNTQGSLLHKIDSLRLPLAIKSYLKLQDQ